MAHFTNNREYQDNQVYRAIAYYRLSKEDSNAQVRKSQRESDSISNQRKFIRAYLQKHPNIQLVDEAYDDGFTGTNFNRPGFRSILSKIDAGKANCVIVKDLSRLGREYIETGKYLETVFPRMGVRFIAINDNVDSANSEASDDLIVPIKNIMNESYCRELSKKLRRQFQIQRSNGEFLGAFAAYGYLKDPADKHKLIIDPCAAEIVRLIFSMVQQGYGLQALADFLSKEGIYAPADYKKSQGLNYKSGFQTGTHSRWNATTLRAILTNPIYIGSLVQGKRGTPNFKIKEMRQRRQEDWITVENNHAPIIDPLQFWIVQQILTRDTRTIPDGEVVLPLAGMVFCGDCQKAMCRRSVTRGKRKFFYYVCSGYKRGSGCSSHSFEQGKLEATVLHAIQSQIQLVLELGHLLQEVGHQNLKETKIRNMDIRIAAIDQDIEKNRGFYMKLYESFCDGMFSRNEYEQMRKTYSDQIDELEQGKKRLMQKQRELESSTEFDCGWIESFRRFEKSETLTREMVVNLVDRVFIFEDKHIAIDFNYRNEFAHYQKILQPEAKEVC